MTTCGFTPCRPNLSAAQTASQALGAGGPSAGSSPLASFSAYAAGASGTGAFQSLMRASSSGAAGPTGTGFSSDGSGSSSSGQAPSLQQTQDNWNANLQQALQYYQAQLQMDREQQAVAFASSVEAKGNQMLMACIQNIR